MHYSAERPENARFVDIARFLKSIQVPTAEVLGHDPDSGYVVQRDLGNTDLWTLRLSPLEIRRGLYQDTLAAIRHLHTYPVDMFPSDRIPLSEPFGRNLYRWERNYFLDNCITKMFGIRIEPDKEKRLESELSSLADRLSSLPPCLIHRDFQSQNVMICKDRPFLIDFQGMRFGTCFYDLGSLLYDPYVEFSEDEREELLRFYFRESNTGLDWNGFRTAFREASVQRLMQALGAFGHLGITRGLRDYLIHVQPGLANLQEAVRRVKTLPCLDMVVSQCLESAGKAKASLDF